MEGTLNIIWFQPPCPHYPRLFQALSTLTLENFRIGFSQLSLYTWCWGVCQGRRSIASSAGAVWGPEGAQAARPCQIPLSVGFEGSCGPIYTSPILNFP